MSYQSRSKTWIAGEVLYASDLNSEFDSILATLIPEPTSTAQGNILYKNATEWVVLAPGTAYQLLQINSGASAPEWTTLDISKDTSPQLGGNLTIGENAVALDYALSADGKYSGLTRAGTAGTNLSFGQIVYLASADSKWEIADADAEATTKPDLGIVIVAGDENASITVLTYGTVREDDWNWSTPGAPLFVEEGTGGTAGTLTETAPDGSGDCIRIAGYVIDANSVFFCPENAWDELV